jgi:hypothetical protein
MKMRAAVSLVTMVAFFFLVSTQDLRAAEALKTQVHSISQADLHGAVLASQKRANEARKSVQELMARSDVKTQIQRMGFSTEKVSTRVASLSDAEIVKLHSQLMKADLQNGTAGLSGAAIALIIIAAVAGTILLLALLYWLAEEELDDDDYYW